MELSSQNSIVSHRSWFIICTRQRFITQVYKEADGTYIFRSKFRLEILDLPSQCLVLGISNFFPKPDLTAFNKFWIYQLS